MKNIGKYLTKVWEVSLVLYMLLIPITFTLGSLLFIVIGSVELALLFFFFTVVLWSRALSFISSGGVKKIIAFVQKDWKRTILFVILFALFGVQIFFFVLIFRRGTREDTNVVQKDSNRAIFFRILFALIGILILYTAPIFIDPNTNSVLRFPNDNPSLSFDLSIPTLRFALAVAFIYMAGGALGINLLGGYQSKQLRSWGLIFCSVLFIPLVLVLAAAGKDTNIVSMLAASFRLATPIIIGAMAGIWCERSGVVNIAIEGMMLTGACFGYVTYTVVSQTIPGQSGLWIGVGIATISGGLMALLHAWLSITFKTDQIISGTVINILALGLTSFIRVEVLVTSDASVEKLAIIKLPILGDLPVLGDILFTGRPIFFFMFFIVIGTHIILYYTRWGLRTRAVGENPGAADTLGVKVQRNRYVNVVIGGLIAGLAGAWFSLETAGGFDDGMTSGAGFIALAAMIFGKWTPFGAAAGGLLFGFAQALDTRFQLLGVPIPVQFVQMTPYIITMIILAGVVGRAIAPKAVGKAYEKE